MSSKGGVSIARNRSGDRFYNPPAVIRHKQQQLMQKQQEEQQIRKKSSPSSSSKTNCSGSIESEKRSERDDCVSSSASEVGSGCSVSHDVVDSLSNLDRFFECTTPFVRAQNPPKMSLRERRKNGFESHPHFVLGDLWESFKEWSMYGAGVPLVLNENDSVVQYYVPYLSGIQLYVDPSRPSSNSSDAESSKDISNNRSNDSGIEGGANETSNFPGQLVFEHLEHVSPFNREPLSDKISVLASNFPELGTYRSCDLSPSSWISVAWYPIYRVPTGPTLQNLDTCFLSFHSLSTKGSIGDFLHPHINTSIREVHNEELSVPLFGLAFYKFKTSVWNPNGVCQKTSSLMLAADNWLRLLKVKHPDYNFFVSRNHI